MPDPAAEPGQGADASREGRPDSLWDFEDSPPRPPGIPDLHLEGFDGPMDLLLDLAERQRIDLGRMSVLALAEQFVAALERLGDQVKLERKADWVVMATRLVLLRARLLFPGSPDEAAAAEREATISLDRLAEAGRMQRAAAWLSARRQLGFDQFSRPHTGAPARDGGYVALMEACLVLLRGRGGRPVDAPIYRAVIPDLWRVSDALVWIRRVLAEGGSEGRGLGAFLPQLRSEDGDYSLKVRAAVASTFLAGLELARAGELGLDQEQSFAMIAFTAVES